MLIGLVRNAVTFYEHSLEGMVMKSCLFRTRPSYVHPSYFIRSMLLSIQHKKLVGI